MTSRNRDIANSIGLAVSNDTITNTGEISGGGSVTTYSTPANLPTSGNEAGDQAFVSSNNRLYIWNGSGWYNIALINTNPSFTIFTPCANPIINQTSLVIHCSCVALLQLIRRGCRFEQGLSNHQNN